MVQGVGVEPTKRIAGRLQRLDLANGHTLACVPNPKEKPPCQKQGGALRLNLLASQLHLLYKC